MSEPRWTRGPWLASGSLVWADRPDDGGTICQVSEVRASRFVEHHEPELGGSDRAEIYANMRLIAAAPDLYAGLSEALDLLAGMLAGSAILRGATGSIIIESSAEMLRLRAVLAKARE